MNSTEGEEVSEIMHELQQTKTALTRLKHDRTAASEYRNEMIEKADGRVKKRGLCMGEFQAKFRDYKHLPPEMTYDDCITMVLESLNWQGVVAWEGDATGIVAQLIEAQYKARKDTEMHYASLRAAAHHFIRVHDDFGMTLFPADLNAAIVALRKALEEE